MSFGSLRPARPKATTTEGPSLASAAGRKFEPPARDRTNSAGSAERPTALSIQERLNTLQGLSKNQPAVSTAANIQQKFEDTTQTAKSIQQSIQQRLESTRPTAAASTPSSPAGRTTFGGFGSFGSAQPKAASAGGSLTLSQKGATPAPTASSWTASARPPRANSQPAGERAKPATTSSALARPGLGNDLLQRLSALPGVDSKPPPSTTITNEVRPDSAMSTSRFSYHTTSSQAKSQSVPQAIKPASAFGGQASKATVEEVRPVTATLATTMPLLEEYLRTRYDPIINTVKEITHRVEKARKLVKRERIRYKWDDKENQGFQPEPNIQPTVDPSKVHVIICALDYIGTSHPLTCTTDGDAMKDLCRACGVTDVSTLYNRQATADAAASKIRLVAGRCKPGDYLVFFYAGHGANVADVDGDEDDGKDEAFCFVTHDGKLYGGWMTDDQFAHHLVSSVPAGVHVLVISDCCHSGTICDFDSRHNQWGSIQAVSLSGCRDEQTSGDTGKGGIFTHSLLMALQELVEAGDGKHISLKRLFQGVLDKDDTIFDSAQDITMNATKTVDLKQFTWPLIPKPGYVAPWKGRRK